MRLKTTLPGKANYFAGLKELFGKVNEEKSGDVMRVTGAIAVSERIAAKIVLSELTLEQIRINPFITYSAGTLPAGAGARIAEVAAEMIKNRSSIKNISHQGRRKGRLS